MANDIKVLAAFLRQAEWCQTLGSPFTARLCGAASTWLDRETAVGRRILDWEGRVDGLDDAVPLRLAGSLHALVRQGAAPKLAAVYPPAPLPDFAPLWILAVEAFEEHEAFILSRLDLPPQTNEVGRSGPLMAGLLVLAQETGLPVSLFELGASAGLNLNLDRFSYRLGELDVGETGSKVRLAPDWTGSSPPAAKVIVAARRGVDISPLDISDPDQRDLLPAYVWPDQSERLSRVLAAIEIGLEHPPSVEHGEAADWIESVLELVGPPGVARVVYHTIASQYFPPATQARIKAHLERTGAAAGKDCLLAWLRYENDPEYDNRASLRLTLWPDGTERVLGAGHPHGTNFRFF